MPLGATSLLPSPHVARLGRGTYDQGYRQSIRNARGAGALLRIDRLRGGCQRLLVTIPVRRLRKFADLGRPAAFRRFPHAHEIFRRKHMIYTVRFPFAVESHTTTQLAP